MDSISVSVNNADVIIEKDDLGKVMRLDAGVKYAIGEEWFYVYPSGNYTLELCEKGKIIVASE